MRRGVGAGRSPTAAGLACGRQHLLQEFPDEAPAPDRAGEQIRVVGVVDLAVVEFLQRLLAVRRRGTCCDVSWCTCWAARRPAASTFFGRMTPNTRGRVRELALSRRDRQRRGRRITPTADVEIGEGGEDAWQQGTVGDERAVSLNGQIALRQAGMTDHGVHDSRVEAPAATNDAWTATDSTPPRAPAEGSTKTVWPSVHAGSPRLDRSHRHRPPRQRRRQHAQSGEPVKISLAGHSSTSASREPSLTKYLFQRRVRLHWSQSALRGYTTRAAGVRRRDHPRPGSQCAQQQYHRRIHSAEFNGNEADLQSYYQCPLIADAVGRIRSQSRTTTKEGHDRRRRAKRQT